MEEATFDIETHAAARASPASWETLELRRAISRAQEGLDDLALPQPVLEDVNRSLEAAAHEAAQPRPDRYGVAEHLAEATTRLKEKDALIDAGPDVVGELRRAVALLGPIGVAVVGTL